MALSAFSEPQKVSVNLNVHFPSQRCIMRVAGYLSALPRLHLEPQARIVFSPQNEQFIDKNKTYC